MQEESFCDPAVEPPAAANATMEGNDDPETDTCRVHHGRTDNDLLSLTVADALAAATGTSPNAIEPLYSVVDPDALDALLAADETADVEVTFTYDDWLVTVRGSGTVTVQKME